MREVWIAKKKWQTLEKRVTDLEGQVQGQMEVEISAEDIREALKKMERFVPVVNFMPDLRE